MILRQDFAAVHASGEELHSVLEVALAIGCGCVGSVHLLLLLLGIVFIGPYGRDILGITQLYNLVPVLYNGMNSRMHESLLFFVEDFLFPWKALKP